MGFFDAIFGRKDDQMQNQTNNQQHSPYDAPARQRPQNADEQALARYRYMLQTAAPEDIEAAHQEAFARLTPEQRQMALQQLTQTVPENEAAQLSDNPRDLARAATRAEMRQPGSVQRMFGGANQNDPRGGQGMMGGMGGGMMGGMGGMMAGGLLTGLAGGFIGSSIANSFFNNSSNEQGFHGSPEAQAVDGGVSDYSGGDFQEAGLDSSADPYGDPADSGGFDNADYAADSGGADFGSGDFGGGDF